MFVCEREEACCHSFQSMTLSPDPSYTTVFKCAALSFPLPQLQVSLHVETVLLLLLHPSQLPFLGVQHISQAANNRFTGSSLMTYLKATIGSVMAVTKNQAKCLLTRLTGKCRAETWNLPACAVYGSDLSFGPLISIWPRLLKAYNGSRIKRAYSDRMHWMIEVASTLLGQLHYCRLNYALVFLKYFFHVSFAQVQRLCISLMRCPLCVADWLLHVLASFH